MGTLSPTRRKHSFFLQYLSVLLIVFALSVAIIHDAPVAEAGVHPAPTLASVEYGDNRSLISELSFEPFESGTANLLPGSTSNFESLLLSHDVFLEVRLSPLKGEPSELVVARAISLRRQFSKPEFEIGALRVFLNFSTGTEQASLKVYRLKEAS